MTEAAVQGTDARVTRGPRAEIHRLVREKKNKYRTSPSNAWSHLAEQRHKDTNAVCHRLDSDEASCGLSLDKQLETSIPIRVCGITPGQNTCNTCHKITRIRRHTEESWDCDMCVCCPVLLPGKAEVSGGHNSLVWSNEKNTCSRGKELSSCLY